MNPIIKAVIVDDERGGRNNLHLLLKEYCPNVTVLGLAENVPEGLKQIEAHQPDILFLDIEMPGQNGFALIDQLSAETKLKTKIVFTTAYEQYAIQAFKVSAVDYLLKPINIEELQRAVAKVADEEDSDASSRIDVLQENYTGKIQKIAIPHQDGYAFLKLEHIVCLEANRNYTLIYHKEKKELLVAKSLRDFEDLLIPSEFYRPHRSYIINLKHVEAWIKKDGGYILMSNEMQIPIVKSRRDDFMRFYQSLG